MEAHQLVNDIYNKFKDEFVSDPEKGSFHNLLWKTLVNQRYVDEEAAFTVSVMEDNELIIASFNSSVEAVGELYLKVKERLPNFDSN